MISRTMAKKSRILQIAFTLTGIGIAFWVGRISTPDQTGKGESTTASEKSGTRSSRRLTSNRQSLGAGEQAITSSSRLRELYKSGDSTKATLALAKMNSDELSSLAQDLAKTCADIPTYMVSTEMKAVFDQWVESDVDAALKFALSSTQNSFKSQATRSIFQKLAKMDPDLARVKLADIPDSALRWQLKRTLYQSLAVTQPDVWLQEIRSDASLTQRTQMSTIAAQWAMEDPVAAAARIQQLPTKLQMDGVASIGKAWASKDPQAAMAWAQAFPQANIKNKAVTAVIGGMAAKNPDAAMAALDRISPSARREGISAIFQTLVNSDFDGALAKASGLTDPLDQKMAYEEMLSSSSYNSRLNVEQITALTKTLTSGSIRNKALEQLGTLLAYHDPQDTQSLLKTYPEKEQVTIQLKMLNRLYYSDPHRAMEIYQSLPSGKVDNYVFANIVSHIAKNDPDMALELVLKEKSSYKQVNAVESVFKSLTDNDPEGAIQRLKDLPEGPLRKEAIEGLAGSWAKTDPDSAIQWAESLQEGEKKKAMLSILPEMAKSSPQDAANWMDTLLATSTTKSQSGFSSVVYRMMDTWAKDDPAAAGAWTSKLPDGQVKNSAIQQLAVNWYKEDSNAAADWIDALPQGKNRDASIGSIASNLQRSDPATAFAWAESIGDDNSRISSLSYVVQSWKDHDKDAVQKMIKKADLSDVERTRLLKKLE
jgi:hypothetical protein